MSANTVVKTFGILLFLSLISAQSHAVAWVNGQKIRVIERGFNTQCRSGQSYMKLRAFALRAPATETLGATNITLFPENGPFGNNITLAMECNSDGELVLSQTQSAILVHQLATWCQPQNEKLAAWIDSIPGFSASTGEGNGACINFANQFIGALGNFAHTAANFGARPVSRIKPKLLRFGIFAFGQNTTYSFVGAGNIPMIGGVINQGSSSNRYNLYNNYSLPIAPVLQTLSNANVNYSCTGKNADGKNSGIHLNGTNIITVSGERGSLIGRLNQTLSLMNCGVTGTGLDGVAFDFDLQISSGYQGTN